MARRELESSGLERIEEGAEEGQQSYQTETASVTPLNLTLKEAQQFTKSLKQQRDHYGGASKKYQPIAKPWKQSFDRRGKPKEQKSSSVYRGRVSGPNVKVSSKYKRPMSKQPSNELLPKKKYVSLRPARH